MAYIAALCCKINNPPSFPASTLRCLESFELQASVDCQKLLQASFAGKYCALCGKTCWYHFKMFLASRATVLQHWWGSQEMSMLILCKAYVTTCITWLQYRILLFSVFNRRSWSRPGVQCTLFWLPAEASLHFRWQDIWIKVWLPEGQVPGFNTGDHTPRQM